MICPVPVLGLLCSLALAIAPPAAGQQTDAAGLIGYLNSLASFSATFEQTRFDEDGQELERSSGDCQIKRPGRFRWNYIEPYPQLIVSDGETLWIYDPDLEQVTENAVGELPPNSPASLLGQQIDIEQHYSVTALEATEDNTIWFELRPKEATADFSSVALGLADGEIKAMRLNDNLGQVTLLKFNDVVRNQPVDDGHFHFAPPSGVDVVRGAAP